MRDALSPGKDCPPIEELSQLLAGSQADLSQHVEACAYCRTELHLLQSFEAREVSPQLAENVGLIVEKLRERSTEIFPPVRRAKPSRLQEWLATFRSPAAILAFASLLIVGAVGLQFWHGGPPDLRPPVASEPDVLRSHSVTVSSPVGDLREAPKQIEWQAVNNAARYEVRLLEVDRTELWKGETSAVKIDLPPAVQARIVPAKTILCEVHAFDAAGRSVAESNTVRFRLLQNIYPR